mgnify:CR=1 FL=1
MYKIKTILIISLFTLITLVGTSCSSVTQTNEEDTLTILDSGATQVTRATSFPSSQIDTTTKNQILSQLINLFPKDFQVNSVVERDLTKFSVTSPFFGDVNSAIVELANSRGQSKTLVSSGTWVKNKGLFSYFYTLNISTLNTFNPLAQASLTVVMPWEIEEAQNAIVSTDRHSATWNLGGVTSSKLLVLKTKPIISVDFTSPILSVIVLIIIITFVLILIFSNRKRNISTSG